VIYLAENNGRVDGKHPIKLDKRLILGLIRVAIEKKLFDALHGKLFMLERNDVCVWSKLVRKGEYICWKCSRKEAYLELSREKTLS
jgi:hypothetical protein